MNEEQSEWFKNWLILIGDETFSDVYDNEEDYVCEGELMDMLVEKLKEWGFTCGGIYHETLTNQGRLFIKEWREAEPKESE